MNFLEGYSLSISLLSPGHIGCGEDYDPTSYVIDGHDLCPFDAGTAADVIGSQGCNDLLTAVSGDPASALLDTQRALFRHRRSLASIATQRIPVIDDVCEHYEARIGRVAQRERNGDNVIHRLEIARTSYDVLTGLPLLPGSSIKGAIRTALLSEALGEPRVAQTAAEFSRRRQRVMALEGQRPREAEREYKKLGASMQPEVLDYVMIEEDRRRINLERDPLRLLKIGDAHYQPKDGRTASSIVWRVNRRRSGQEGKGLATLVEAMNASPSSHFQSGAYRGDLRIDVGTALGRDNTPKRRFGLAEIVRACNRFYHDKLREEIDRLESVRSADPVWISKLRQQVFSSEFNGKPTMGHQIAAGRGFLLRLGRHSGAECVTVDGLRRIYIRQHEKFSDHAWTTWLAAMRRGEPATFRPFGWVFVQARPL